MPDLLKNADKTINIHPEKLTAHPNAQVNSILQGWKKHLEVDRYFHSSEFFAYHSHQLKLVLKPAMVGSVVKPFFLGHVALELVLDNLLITVSHLNVDHFYQHLEDTDTETLRSFLNYSGMNDTERFFKFFVDFKRHRYLHTYAEAGQIAYALKRICMRIWQDPFTPLQEATMTDVLLEYRTLLSGCFMQIFDEIAEHLS